MAVTENVGEKSEPWKAQALVGRFSAPQNGEEEEEKCAECLCIV